MASKWVSEWSASNRQLEKTALSRRNLSRNTKDELELAT